MARNAYNKWYPLLHEHQKVAQLPGLFGWNESICPLAIQEKALLDKLRGFRAWADEDERVVGMLPCA